MRVFFVLALMLIGLAPPILAQDDPAPWQAAITGQIEAFRAADGATALSFAGEGFRTRFTDPDEFIAAIAATGYGAILLSRSHSFGEFNKVSETVVVQVVRFVGPKQELYEALYQLRDEPGEGWRVQGVGLRKQAGISI